MSSTLAIPKQLFCLSLEHCLQFPSKVLAPNSLHSFIPLEESQEVRVNWINSLSCISYLCPWGSDLWLPPHGFSPALWTRSLQICPLLMHENSLEFPEPTIVCLLLHRNSTVKDCPSAECDFSEKLPCPVRRNHTSVNSSILFFTCLSECVRSRMGGQDRSDGWKDR